jgi:hypothetical protein
MGNLPVKYLGVPFITGRLKSADYQVLVDKTRAHKDFSTGVKTVGGRNH